MTHRETLVGLMREGRVVKWRDLAALAGEPIPNWVLWDMIRDGTAVRENRGYRLAEVTDDTYDRFVDLSVRHPAGILCLYSALRLSARLDPAMGDLTDEGGTVDTVALPRNSDTATLRGARIVRWSKGTMFVDGIEERTLNGNRVRLTSPERSVADLFRPVHGIPRGDALQALGALGKAAGEGAVTASLGFARRLGWLPHMEMAAQAVKEMLRCVPPRP